MHKSLWLLTLASCSVLVGRIDNKDACGNGLLQFGLAEQCDDGNTADGDGCDQGCQNELVSEVEPNNTTAQAQPLTGFGGRVTAKLSSGGDIDFYHFTVTATTSLTAEVTLAEGSGGSCANGDNDPDTVMYLFNSAGKILAEDDDGGPGDCSKLVLKRLAPGDYFLRINDFSFTDAIDIYQLEVTVSSVCGDGLIEENEECDDQNTIDGDGCEADCTDGDNCGDGILDRGEQCEQNAAFADDGCDPSCQITAGEFFEIEPNDDAHLEESNANTNSDFLFANANGPFTSDVIIHGGCLINGGDEDFFLVQNDTLVPRTINIITADPVLGFGVACGSNVDTEISIYRVAGQNLGPVIDSNDDINNPTNLCSSLQNIIIGPNETLALQVFEANDDEVLPAYLVKINFP